MLCIWLQVNLAQAARGRGNVRQYRVQLPARLREGFELDSDVVGMLDPGGDEEERPPAPTLPTGHRSCLLACSHTTEIIRVVETRCHENGVDRVRCSRQVPSFSLTIYPPVSHHQRHPSDGAVESSHALFLAQRVDIHARER